MRKILAFLLLCFPGIVSAQSILPISADQCAWRSGDDPAWAGPAYDDTGWQASSEQSKDSYSPHAWLRCRVNLDAVRPMAHPAVRIITVSAYELFLNGQLIGREGNLHTGIISEDNFRQFAIPSELSTASPAVLAIRQSFREPGDLFPKLALGDSAAFDAERSHMVLQQVRPSLPYVIGFSILGVLGFVQLGLFFYTTAVAAISCCSASSVSAPACSASTSSVPLRCSIIRYVQT